MKSEALTYHNDPKFKRAFVKETRWHREQDLLIKGKYESGGKFCSVGCSVNSLKRLGRNSIEYGDHAGLANLLGWPEWLCRLQDTIFEGLPETESAQWTELLAEAVPVGKNLDVVKWQFCAFLMRENVERVLTMTIGEKLKEQVVASVRGVLAVHEKAIQTGQWNESAAWSAAKSAWAAAGSAWSAAGSAARSAAWSARSAAGSAGRSAAESAAWAAAESASRSARAAESAAWAAESAARSAAWSAGRSAASHTRYSKELLRLLKSHK